jgi:uncharacterized protein YecT (DUF1311 family)
VTSREDGGGGLARRWGVKTVPPVLAMSIVLASGASGSAAKEISPGFDCKLARTPLETEMCSDEGIPFAWLDRTMADLFDLVRKTKTSSQRAAFVAAQKAWLQQRNACNDKDKPFFTCLPAVYDRRFSAIATTYGEGAMTGIYRNDAGTLQSVVFPDKSFAFEIDTTQGYKSCFFTGRGVFVDGRLHYQERQDPKLNLGASSCNVDIRTTGPSLSVKSDGCYSSCGAFTTFDGLFTRTSVHPPEAILEEK